MNAMFVCFRVFRAFRGQGVYRNYESQNMPKPLLVLNQIVF